MCIYVCVSYVYVYMYVCMYIELLTMEKDMCKSCAVKSSIIQAVICKMKKLLRNTRIAAENDYSNWFFMT
jgi:hypothetical protein